MTRIALLAATMNLFRDRTTDWFNAFLFILLLALMIGSLTIGRYPVPLLDVLRIVFTTSPFSATGNANDTPWIVIEIIRLPRILLATVCGMGLALAGAAMQGVFRNPLVGPEIAGVSSGAAVGGVAAILLSLSQIWIIAFAFGAGLLALLAATTLAKTAGRATTLALVLAGIIVGGFCGAIVGLLEILADPISKLPSIVYWLLGSFSGATYVKVAAAAIPALVAGVMLLTLSWRINLLSLGELDARSLGVRVELLRWTLMALVAIVVAAQVAVSGIIGWVGLIVPHFARMIVGPNHTRLMPTAALLGGIYLLVVDDIARGPTAQEIPISILTSIIGTPFFAFLFWRTQSTGWSRD